MCICFLLTIKPPQSSLSLHEPSSSTAAASACQLQDAHRLQDLLHPFTTPAGEVIVDKRSLSRRRKTSYTRGLVHGTNVRAAMYILLEGWYSYCSDLSKSDMPTYRSFSQGAPIGRTDSQILGWRLSGLVYRASTQVKGQLPVLLGLVCAVAFPHLRLNAGGNDLAQLKTVVTGVVTTSEKYAISRSEHTTAASLIITHHQQGTVQIQDLQILRAITDAASF